jgi:hypothetical protein
MSMNAEVMRARIQECASYARSTGSLDRPDGWLSRHQRSHRMATAQFEGDTNARAVLPRRHCAAGSVSRRKNSAVCSQRRRPTMTSAARVCICRAIESVEMVRGRKDYPLADRVLQVLRQMLNEVDTCSVPERRSRGTGIGRLVLDSWPYTDRAGSDVSSAVNAYLELP